VADRIGASGLSPDEQQFNRVRALREGAPKAEQNRLGPLEHGLWAEMVGREYAPLGGPMVAAATPAYSVYKALRPGVGRSDASVAEVTEGLSGALRGHAGAVVDKALGLENFAPFSGSPSLSARMDDDELQNWLARKQDEGPAQPMTALERGGSPLAAALRAAAGRHPVAQAARSAQRGLSQLLR